MGKRKKEGWGYYRVGLVAIEDVLPLILDPSVEKAEFLGHMCGVSSLRLRTFAIKGLECSSCELKATHFAVEAHERANGAIPESFHLNLWADRTHLDKGEMLMTHDHTLARGLGGKDHISNCTTMCSKCNHIKSIQENIDYCELKGLPLPGSAKDKPKKLSAKRQAQVDARAAHDKPLLVIPMELAVRQYQAALLRAQKKAQKEHSA